MAILCSVVVGSSSQVRRQLEYLAARTALLTLQYLPLKISERLALGYARLLDLFLPRLRRTALRNLTLALPQADAHAITDGIFRSIGRLLLTLSRFAQIDKSNVGEYIEYEGFEHYRQAKARGKGVLFATAHLGNWELSAFAHALLTEPMHVVVRPLDNPAVDNLVEQRRMLSGNSVIRKTDAARDILRALHRNEAVGILIDQNASLDEGVFIDFFGIPACTGLAFAKIANRSGAAVIPGFALWSESKRKYILRFYPIVEMTGSHTGDTQRIHTIIESVIREYPDQWLWIHRRWKTQPPSS
ncbi:MAG: lipid A biosynthesis acyltransferase [Bryobacteraceae bacterium]